MYRVYNATIILSNGKGRTKTFEAEIEFYRSECFDYGNGCSMAVTSELEPFGTQGYDLRYCTEFNKNNPAEFIAEFYKEKYDGRNGAWKLAEIQITEAE